jgi:imidazolonepropionase-like amidohydrolase
MALQILKISNCLIQYGRLWDGVTDALSGPGTLCIKDGLICDAAGFLPAKKHDLSQLTLLPALIDCHLHLCLPSCSTTELSKRVLSLLAAGVAAVRDAGSSSPSAFSLPPLRMVTTGQAIGRAGFYGAQLGIQAENAVDAALIIDNLASSGVNQIKLIASGIFSFNSYGEVGPPPFSVEELSIITNRALRYNLPVMAHASGDEAVRRCLQAGVHSIEHGYFMSKETLRRLADSGTCWVPTLSPVYAQLDGRPGNGQASLEVIKRSLEKQMQLVSEAAELGVTMGAGTDAGAPGVFHGPSLHREISLLAECGLPLPRAMRTATADAAAICGLTEDMGTVAPGRKPYLLAVKNNPLESLDALKNIEYLLLPS